MANPKWFALRPTEPPSGMACGRRGRRRRNLGFQVVVSSNLGPQRLAMETRMSPVGTWVLPPGKALALAATTERTLSGEGPRVSTLAGCPGLSLP